ncbi:MAG TPA: hypothetical protein VEP73_06065, partial [Actinomycetota bacterium]|nr:hypothetical protein [Actinomycetota bacterium]
RLDNRPTRRDRRSPGQHVTSYLTVYNTIRPHEAIAFATPLVRYLQAPSIPPRANLHQPGSVSDS